MTFLIWCDMSDPRCSQAAKKQRPEISPRRCLAISFRAQYSLRALLALLVMCSCFFAGVAFERGDIARTRARIEAEAAKDIQRRLAAERRWGEDLGRLKTIIATDEEAANIERSATVRAR